MKYMGDFGGAIKGEELGASLLDSVMPDFKQTAIAAAKSGAVETVNYIWAEYKTEIVLTTGIIALLLAFNTYANYRIAASNKL
jgi:hypothetical protein